MNTTETSSNQPSLLRRPEGRRLLAGVAAGLADYFEIDATIVRIAFVVLAMVGGVGLPLYLAGCLLIPEESSDTAIAEEVLHHVRAR